MGNVGAMEIVLLGIVAVLIFGAAKLPELGRTFGKGLREFKESVGGATDFKDALGTVNEVRSAVTPTNLAATFIPGVGDVRDTVTAARGAVTGEETAAEGEAEVATPTPSAPSS